MKLLDEGLLGATGLVPVVVVEGSVSPVVEQNPDKVFPVKGMLRQGFLGSKAAPSLASSSALASNGTSEALAVPVMVSVGPMESEDGYLDLDPDLDPQKCALGASPLVFALLSPLLTPLLLS